MEIVEFNDKKRKKTGEERGWVRRNCADSDIAKKANPEGGEHEIIDNNM